MVLVYLGRGVFGGTMEKPFLHKPMGPAVPKTKPVKDDNYIMQGMYEQESARRPHTRSMGSPQPSASGASGSSTKPASESSQLPDEPDDTLYTPPKPKHQPRKPKQIVVKEKSYRICCGSRHTQKQCSLCNEKFPSQGFK